MFFFFFSSTFHQPHYVPDNYKRNGGRSAWKSERPKGVGGCEEEASPGQRADDFRPENEDGLRGEADAEPVPEEPTPPPVPPQQPEAAETGEGEEEEEEEESRETEEHRELEEGATERVGEMLELPSSSSSSSPLHHAGLGKREAQRDRLNKILLDLLHRTPSKNGEGTGIVAEGQNIQGLFLE